MVFLIDRPVCAAGPSERRTNLLDDPPRCIRPCRGLRENLRHLALEDEPALHLYAGGDVPHESAVARELSARIEHRPAAGGDVAQLAAGVDVLVEKVGDRLACLELGLMTFPTAAVADRIGVRQFPTGLAVQRLRIEFPFLK